MANRSWIVVCSLLLIGSMAVQAAKAEPAEPEDNKNASSSMYFHQLFSQESVGNTDDQGPEAVSTVNHPSSIQAINSTVNGGNLSSSETQQYYGYEPTGGKGINKRHVHYPPVPMDVINSDDSANDDYDNDEGDDADYDDDDDGQQNNPQQGSEDDGDGGEDRDDDFDHAASFAIPKIDTNHKGCKTVYKEIQTVPGKVKSADDDFDADFGFKRRRRKRSAPNSATASSYVVSRECHYSDSEAKERNKLANPLPPPAAAAAGKGPTEMPSPMPNAPAGAQSDLAGKPKVTGESRFVPINADPWRPRATRGVGGFGERMKAGGPLGYDYKVASTPFMEADDATVKKTQMLFDQDGQNSQHFHKYPYPHYHIYYNRKGSSVLDENALYNGNDANKANAAAPAAPVPTEEADADSEGDNGGGPYESPNSYFEFTHPNGGGDDSGNSDGGNQDDEGDYDDGGDNSEGGDEGDDDGLAAAPVEAESRASRSRRGVKRQGQRSPALPLPPTLSPSSQSSAGLQNDDAWDFTISGPNYYKTGTYEAGNGKKPKKYSYNFFKSEDPSKGIDDSYTSDSAASTRDPHIHSHEIDHGTPERRADNDGDYDINYGSGSYKEFNDEYDSNKKKPEQSDEAGGHGDNGGDGQYQDNDGQQEEDEDDWGVDGFPQI